jgi:hypothetical protein
MSHAEELRERRAHELQGGTHVSLSFTRGSTSLIMLLVDERGGHKGRINESAYGLTSST